MPLSRDSALQPVRPRVRGKIDFARDLRTWLHVYLARLLEQLDAEGWILRNDSVPLDTHSEHGKQGFIR